ncbi:MAG: hypothetical protein PHU63_00190 [Candidatus ainarchaeum sp.]|nr:hypothetical protein [Candidatus ainarchaeum sp.]
MVNFKDLDPKSKARVIEVWSRMSESDKTHFVNQVAIALSVLGTDNGGKQQIEDVVKKLIEDGANNLADFGLYLRMGLKQLNKFEIRTVKIVDNYRMKYNLPTLPSKPLV